VIKQNRGPALKRKKIDLEMENEIYKEVFKIVEF
jgi:hypothetical protein